MQYKLQNGSYPENLEYNEVDFTEFIIADNYFMQEQFIDDVFSPDMTPIEDSLDFIVADEADYTDHIVQQSIDPDLISPESLLNSPMDSDQMILPEIYVPL